MRKSVRQPIIRVVALVLGAMLLCPATLSAGVPRALVEELESVVEEGLSSEDPEARAWAIRAKAMLGRSASSLLLDSRDNTDLLVRVMAGVGLLEIGNREGAELLSRELVEAGVASRQRILSRYVRHLSERDQERLLEGALDATSDAEIVADILDFIVVHGQGRVFDLMERAERTDDALRSVYVEAAVSSGRPEAIGLARRLGRSSDPAVRQAAVSIAAGINSEDARGLLAEFLNDADTGVAMGAALALAPMGVAASYDRLADLALGADAEQQTAALEAIRDGQPSVLNMSSLLAMLEGAEDPTLRRRIFEAIGATGSDEAYQLLTEMVEGTVYEDRLDGIAGLGFTRREGSVPTLGAVLLGGGGDDLRGLAAEALGHLNNAAATQPLLDALQRERGGVVKTAVIEALAAAPSEDALWPLAFQLSNDDEDVVVASLRTLQALGATSVASQVENAAISHRNAQVRWTATLVLFSLDPEVGTIRLNQALDRPPEGFMADIDALPEGPRLEAYQRLIRHSNPDIRLLVVGRILSLGDDCLPIMRELLGPTSPSDMRQLAADTLTANRALVDLPVFWELSETSHRTMRYQALEAIVELAAPDSEERLRALLDSTDLEQRVMAAYGLWKLGSN